MALLVAMAAFAPGTAHGQSALGHITGGAAAVGGMGGRTQAVLFGGGGEILRGPYGFGADIDSIQFPLEEHTFDQGRGVAASPELNDTLLSFNGACYPGDSSAGRRVRPFVTGGVSFLPDNEGGLALLDAGGGVDWWVARRAGLRLEVRGLYPALLSFRCGVVFR